MMILNGASVTPGGVPPPSGSSAQAPAVATHLRPGERVLWTARPSLVGLLPIFAYAFLAVAGVLVSAFFGFEQPGAILTGSAGVALALGGVLIESVRRFVRLKFTIFVVTDERFYAITDFLEVNVRSVPLARATSVSLRQSLAGRVFGFWNARIGTYGENARALEVPAIRDGHGLLREVSAGMQRGANVGWLRGD